MTQAAVPVVSVLMPAYNAQPYLQASIDSITRQTHPDFELIIVDDGSTDDTPAILAAQRDWRIRVIRQDNAGEAAARNTLIAHARAPYVVWQDADDISAPNRLGQLLTAADRTGATAVHSDMLLIDPDNTPIGYWAAGDTEPGTVLARILACGTPFNNASMLIRREHLTTFTFDTSMPVGTDTDLVARALADQPTAHVAQPLLFYRRHPAGASRSPYAFQDVAAMLERHAPTDLVPEAVWRDGSPAEQTAFAQAVIALRLAERGCGTLAADRAASAAALLPDCGPHVAVQVRGIISLAAGNPQAAAEAFLAGQGGPKALLYNLLGEALARLGDPVRALSCFMEAQCLDPLYAEPAVNIRALGAAGFNLVDARWRRFA